MCITICFLFSGSDFGGHGSCKGDSGGAVMKLVTRAGTLPHFVQVGMVQGGVGECGSRKYPGIYIRMHDPVVLNFIHGILGKGTNRANAIQMFAHIL